MKLLHTFDPAKRAAEKAASRCADAHALATGAKSRAQLREENGLFAIPDAVMLLEECSRLS